MTKNNSWLPRDLLLLLAYFSLATILTWPTITHLSTYLPGDGGDDPAIAWNLWWVKYALLNTGQNPFQTNFMFYPIGLNLAFYTLTVLNAATALPITLNFGVVTASNLHMFFTFVAGGYGAFLLARYVLVTSDRLESRGAEGQGSRGENSPLPPRSPAPPLLWVSTALAGGFYAFAGSKLFYVALGQFNIASSHWLPFAVLYVLRTRRDPHHLKNPLMAGLFLTLQAWSELTYASFLLVFIALYGLWELTVWIWANYCHPTHSQFRQRHTAGGTQAQFTILPSLRAALILAITFTLGLSPILAQMLPDLRTEGDFLVEGSGFADAFSADLLGFIVPTKLHPFLGDLISHTHIQGFDKGQHIYLGLVFLGLLLVALPACFRRAEVRFWVIATVIFALLCLGPVISVNGYMTGLPGPFVLFQNLPFFKGNRYPSRYSVMLLLNLSVIAAFALAQIGRWTSRLTPHASGRSLPLRRLIFLLLALLFLFEHLSLPLPQSDMRVPAAYQAIATDPGDFSVLDIPFAWRNGFRITGALTTQFMFGQFYQTAYQKPLLQGNTSRNPEFKFQYFTAAPIINSLLALETGHPLPPERWETDRASAGAVLTFFNIKYIVVRPYHYDKVEGQKNVSVTEQAILPYIENVLPVEKIHDEATIKIYRVIPPETSKLNSGLRVNTSSPLAPLYFGEGWGLLTPGQPIAAQREKVRLLLPLTSEAQRLTLRLRLSQFYGGSAQSFYLELNGWQSPAQIVTPEWQELAFDLPAGVARPGLNDLWLYFAEVMATSDIPTEVPEITVISAGEEVGNFGHIFVNGADISPNQRGYNVAIIQPGDIHTANFDTFLDATASTALARFIAAAPPSALIAVAAADEASANLSEEAIRALQAAGAKGDLRGCFRCSHTFIRSPSGATFEALDPLKPVGITSGLGLTEPGIAAEIEWLEIEPIEP